MDSVIDTLAILIGIMTMFYLSLVSIVLVASYLDKKEKKK